MIRNSRFLALAIALALVAGTILGWNLKIFAIEQNRSDTQREICDSLYDTTSNLIALHATPPTREQIRANLDLAGQNPYVQISPEPQTVISDNLSFSVDPRLDAAQLSNLKTLISSYGLSCNNSKKIKLQNDLEQAIAERARRNKEEQPK